MIETIVIKIGKVILSKLIWIGIGFLLALLLFATLCQPEPVIVTIGGTQWLKDLRDMSKPEFPHFVFIKSKDGKGKTDTFTIHETTQIGTIPIQTDTIKFPISIYVNDKPDPAHGIAYFTYRGISHSVRFDIEAKQIKIKSDEKSIRLCGSVGLGYLNQGSIYAPAKIGLMFKDRISVSGVAGYLNKWYVGGLLEVHF